MMGMMGPQCPFPTSFEAGMIGPQCNMLVPVYQGRQLQNLMQGGQYNLTYPSYNHGLACPHLQDLSRHHRVSFRKVARYVGRGLSLAAALISAGAAVIPLL